jgi:DNA-binding transcriptional ArsR family regulator
MDFCKLYNVCNDLDVNGAWQYMKDLPISDFKKIFLQYETIDIKKITKDFQIDMIETLGEFYNEYFCRELLYIEQLLIRTLKKDVAVGQKNGIWNYIDNIHSRLEVTDNAILFHKHTLYTVPIETLKLIKVRISSFINPHLLMDYSEDSVQVTRMVHVEKREDIVPDDLTKLLKALSDETRLKILRKLYRGRESTSSLAEMLKLTEACISKHLKLLYVAELLQREREGNYIYYSLDTSMLDRIPLFMYEYLA